MGGTINNSELTYPVWKSVIWRFVRAGVAGGIGSVATVAIVLQPDLSNIKTFFLAIIAAFITGFISAAMLYLRGQFGNNDRSQGVINKLPV